MSSMLLNLGTDTIAEDLTLPHPVCRAITLLLVKIQHMVTLLFPLNASGTRHAKLML